MKHLGEVKLKAGKERLVLKGTIRSLYTAMHELECDNKLSNLINMIDQMDLNALYTLLKHMSGDKRDVEELMDLDIKLTHLADAIGKCLKYSLGDSDQDK